MLDTSVTFGATLDETATIVAGELEIELSFFGASSVTVDSALSASSTNPVQNKVINTALGLKVTAPTEELETEPEDTNYFAIFTTSWLQLTWANVKAWLKSYFDTIYAAVAHVHTHASTTSRDATDSHSIGAITDLQAALNGKAATSHTQASTTILFVIEELTGTDTLTAADSGKHFYSTSASDYNLTIDSGLTHPISIFQKGNGVVTVISGSGTPALVGNVKTGGANTAIAIVPESTTVYEVIGGVA